MAARHATELLYDSEAALRLVDSAIEDIRDAGSSRELPDSSKPNALRDLLAKSGQTGSADVSEIVARSYDEIVRALGSLRESRTVLHRTSVGALQQTHDSLHQISTATEIAATDILDGLDRAVALVNDMDAKATAGDNAGGVALRNKLRDELFALMGCMQFQDITAQQLNYASSVLTAMETRLAELASVLDPATLGASAKSLPAAAAGRALFDPAAPLESPATRQAIADEILAASQPNDARRP